MMLLERHERRIVKRDEILRQLVAQDRRVLERAESFRLDCDVVLVGVLRSWHEDEVRPILAIALDEILENRLTVPGKIAHRVITDANILFPQPDTPQTRPAFVNKNRPVKPCWNGFLALAQGEVSDLRA